jgi:predicted nuclease with TOPRIM domain
MSDDEMTTQPTIDTILARFDEWGAKFLNELSEIRQVQEDLRTGQVELRQNVDELRKGQDEVRKGQEQLRTDLNNGLRRVERKIEILNDNLLSIKADVRDLEVRMEKLESESLART